MKKTADTHLQSYSLVLSMLTNTRAVWWFTTTDEALGVPLSPQHSNRSCQQEPWRKGRNQKISPHFSSSPWPGCVETSCCEYIYLFGVCAALRNVWKDEQNLSAGYVGDRAGRAQSPSLPLLGHYSSGNICLWLHGGQRPVYLLNSLGSWVAFSVMQRGRLTVCRQCVDVQKSQCILYYLCQLAHLPSHSSSPRR